MRRTRIVKVVTHHDRDIALLQEVDEGVPRSRELDLAKELALAMGYPHFAVGHNVSMKKGRYRPRPDTAASTAKREP